MENFTIWASVENKKYFYTFIKKRYPGSVVEPIKDPTKKIIGYATTILEGDSSIRENDIIAMGFNFSTDMKYLLL